jgi:predicted methyltransferase
MSPFVQLLRASLLPILLALTACSTPRARETPVSPPAAPAAAAAPAPAPRVEPAPAPQDPIDAAANAPDRSEADRALDAGRKPAELLHFFGIAPGMQVADLAAGGGYTTELLARVVGQGGRVYGQNTKLMLERFAQGPWSERLAKPVMQNVVRVDADMDAPLPSSVGKLDAVLMVLFYHDTVWLKTDRARMNRAIYAALAPGGVYGIVDHSARPGDGVKQVETLHRIEQSVVIAEVEAAGFVLEEEASFLANPADARDWNASPMKAGDKRGTSDRFVLRFRKPKDGYVKCPERRSNMCTKIYLPVCADVDTGIRCIRAPCPSVEQKTYASDCTACADTKVIGHRPGACKTEAPSAEKPKAPGAVTE